MTKFRKIKRNIFFIATDSDSTFRQCYMVWKVNELGKRTVGAKFLPPKSKLLLKQTKSLTTKN